MKKTFFKSLAGIAAVAFAVSCTAPVPKYKMVIVDAPFAMEPIKECVFPEQDFSIVDYGAVKGGRSKGREREIIPFIIDGIPHSKDRECFHAQLTLCFVK